MKTSLLLLHLALLPGPGLAADQKTPDPKKAPPPKPFQNIRFEEDWSSATVGPGYKRIPLSDGVLLSLGGQIRFRAELWDNFTFLDEGGDDIFGLSRIRFHADLYAGRHFRLFAEGKSSLATDRDLPGGLRTLDVDSLELHNAIADLRFATSNDTCLIFRLGRQEMLFGKQRLVSARDWSNTRFQTFDAARAILQMGTWRMDGFWGRQVRVLKYAFNPNAPPNTFFGAYLSGKISARSPTLDLYWLGLKRPQESDEERHTMGSRVSGRALGSLDYDFEGAYQRGSKQPLSVRAWMFGSQVGWSLPSVSRNPRLFIGFDYGSGDHDPNDHQLETFDPLFPSGHAHLGAIDLVGRQNIVDLSAGIGAPVLRRTTARFETHFLWRAQEQDALYNPVGGVVRAGFPGSSLEVGQELGATLIHSLVSGTTLSWGVYHFLAGDFIAETGPAKNTTLGFVALQYTF